MNKKKLLSSFLFLCFLFFSVPTFGANVTYTNPQISLIRNTGANIDSAVTDGHYFKKNATVASLVCQHLGETFVSYTTGYPTGSSVPIAQNYGDTTTLWYHGGNTASTITSITCAQSSVVSGCTDSASDNYDPNATQDDGSCYIAGCTNPISDNYNSSATQDDGSCYKYGCTNSGATNYDPNATIDNSTCYVDNFYGCTNPQATNYNPSATIEDNSCYIAGCTDSQATNYNPSATIEDNSCLFSGSGSFIIQNNITPPEDSDDIFSKEEVFALFQMEMVLMLLFALLVSVKKLSPDNSYRKFKIKSIFK